MQKIRNLSFIKQNIRIPNNSPISMFETHGKYSQNQIIECSKIEIITEPIANFKEQLNKSVEEAKEFILSGLTKGIEYGVTISCSTGKILGKSIGNSHSVQYNCVPPNIKYIALHGHPLHKSSSTEYTNNFSVQDVQNFIKRDNCAEIWVIDSYGNINKIKKTIESNKNIEKIEEYLKEYSEIDIMTCVDFWKEFCKKFHYEYEEGFTCKGSNGSIRDLKYSVKAASNYFNKAANKTTYYNQCF